MFTLQQCQNDSNTSTGIFTVIFGKEQCVEKECLWWTVLDDRDTSRSYNCQWQQFRMDGDRNRNVEESPTQILKRVYEIQGDRSQKMKETSRTILKQRVTATSWATKIATSSATKTTWTRGKAAVNWIERSRWLWIRRSVVLSGVHFVVVYECTVWKVIVDSKTLTERWIAVISCSTTSPSDGGWWPSKRGELTTNTMMLWMAVPPIPWTSERYEEWTGLQFEMS